MDLVIGSLKNIFEDALIAASTDEPVLILGETGTGK
jgi:transcriptional regulator with PAS, ATPase and Fis domain